MVLDCVSVEVSRRLSEVNDGTGEPLLGRVGKSKARVGRHSLAAATPARPTWWRRVVFSDRAFTAVLTVVFLVEAFHGNEPVADSVNHLLVVGFYLINVGYVTLALKYGDKPHSSQEAFEFLSTKVGLVLLILGLMHFFNVLSFAKIRRRQKRQSGVPRLPTICRDRDRNALSVAK